MRWVASLAIFFACAACRSPSGDEQVATLGDQTQPVCHGFTTPVKAGGRPEQASGEACEQPDGTWQVAQNTPGLPAQTYVLPPAGQSTLAPAAAAPQPPSSQSPCNSYTASVTVGGQPRQATIEACPQPDGSWKITQSTPGLPAQVYEVPAPASSPYPYVYPYPIDYAYPEFFPYWVGAPWYFGLAPSIVVVQRFHHFHRGFGPGFGHGFVRGFGPGVGRGFAAAHGAGGHR